MGIFGYRGCKVDRKDRVVIRRKNAEADIVVAEQLTTGEAKECFCELKKLILNKDDFIEINDTNDKTICF